MSSMERDFKVTFDFLYICLQVEVPKEPRAEEKRMEQEERL